MELGLYAPCDVKNKHKVTFETKTDKAIHLSILLRRRVVITYYNFMSYSLTYFVDGVTFLEDDISKFS